MAIAGQACGLYLECDQCIDQTLTGKSCVWCFDATRGFCGDPDSLCPALFPNRSIDSCPATPTTTNDVTTSVISTTTDDDEVTTTTTTTSDTESPRITDDSSIESDMTWLYALLGGVGGCCLLLAVVGGGVLLMRRNKNNNNNNVDNNNEAVIATTSSSSAPEFASARDESLGYMSVTGVLPFDDTNVLLCLNVCVFSLSFYFCAQDEQHYATLSDVDQHVPDHYMSVDQVKATFLDGFLACVFAKKQTNISIT
jgi:hypothetical protein